MPTLFAPAGAGEAGGDGWGSARAALANSKWAGTFSGLVGRTRAGSIRLAPAFLVGTAFRMVTGADLAVMQRGQLWSTSDPYDITLAPGAQEYSVEQGGELAAAIAIATDPTKDVMAYLREQHVPVSKLIVLTPPGGPAKDGSVADSTAANALAVGIRDHLRGVTRPVRRMHLFLACPMGLSLFLGHRWNRLCQTVVYEDIKVDEGYEPAFTIEA
ncbi:SAVED domain-containing protein [Kitasatospora sp. NPDC059160]|uniref:SAVED domain-containing protein n=1 Tax=Kitasatospora sp. NPDC059160 TaxID=3346748 RepID=UPI00369564B7